MVDDSALVRQIFQQELARDPELEAVDRICPLQSIPEAVLELIED